jgi:hypothetical protein
MVVISAPSSCQAKIVHDFIATPFTCTTQAPHCDVSQPTCVPVSRSVSRRYWTSKVLGSIFPDTGFPLTVIDTAAAMGLSHSYGTIAHIALFFDKFGRRERHFLPFRMV